MRTRNLSTICFAGRRTASIGRGCGSIWPATPIAPGYADDPPRTIWAYRDWVIKAINDNKPFDQFTIEQIAGDLLPNPTEDQLIATAFHRNTLTNSEGGTQDEEFRNAAVVDRVNTTMAVWMGTTMACAQCHTHKFDPISQHEYFQLFAILNNTQDADRQRRIARAADLYRRPVSRAGRACSPGLRCCKRFLHRRTTACKDRHSSCAARRRIIKRDLKPSTTVPIHRELTGEPRQTRLEYRGNYLDKGPVVEPGLPGIFHLGVDCEASEPVDSGALAGRQGQSAHRTRRRQSILGGSVRPRHRFDERGLRIAGRAADSSRAVGLAGGPIYG